MFQQPNILIIGGGLAGLFCALKLAPRPVTVLAFAPIGKGASTAWAQGGIAAAVAEGDIGGMDLQAPSVPITKVSAATSVSEMREDELRKIMSTDVGLIREAEGHAIAEISRIEREASSPVLRNMAAAAPLIGLRPGGGGKAAARIIAPIIRSQMRCKHVAVS